MTGYSYRPEDEAGGGFGGWGVGGGALAVVAGHSCLFLGETQQLLPDGFDQRGRGVCRGRRVQGRRRRQIARPRGVKMDRGRRGLPDNTSGRLENRGGRVVRTVQELKAGRREGKEGK